MKSNPGAGLAGDVWGAPIQSVDKDDDILTSSLDLFVGQSSRKAEFLGEAGKDPLK